jgi:hypothetical protein
VPALIIGAVVLLAILWQVIQFIWPILLIIFIVIVVVFVAQVLRNSNEPTSNGGIELRAEFKSKPDNVKTDKAIEAQKGTVFEEWWRVRDRLGYEDHYSTNEDLRDSIRYAIGVWKTLKGLDTPIPDELYIKAIDAIFNSPELLQYASKWSDSVYNRRTPWHRTRLTQNDYFNRVASLF